MTIFSYKIKLYIPASHSLKEKRGILKRLSKSIHHKFDISTAELNFQDAWQTSLIGMVWITSDLRFGQKVFEALKEFLNTEYPNLYIENEEIEVI